jgi:hypothetical protein
MSKKIHKIKVLSERRKRAVFSKAKKMLNKMLPKELIRERIFEKGARFKKMKITFSKNNKTLKGLIPEALLKDMHERKGGNEVKIKRFENKKEASSSMQRFRDRVKKERIKNEAVIRLR